MRVLILKMNPSIRIKFRVLDKQQHELFRGTNKGLPDFWDTFLGWIISLPNHYQFNNGLSMRRKLSSMKIVFDGQTTNHQFTATINNPSLNRGGKKRPSYFQIDGQQYSIYRLQRGNYFSLYNDQEKIMAMKKDHHHRDTFEAAFNDQLLDDEIASMIMLALADSI